MTSRSFISVAHAATALLVALMLGACAVTPEPEGPVGAIDPKEELVTRIKDSPTDLDAHADLLRLQIRDGDGEGAEATVFHALKHNGTDYRTHLLAAQYHRWQADLISAEKSLLASRDLAPTRLEPRVALSGLYHQAYLEADELEQRRVALELADAAYREEFALDYAYACAQLGRDADALPLVEPMADDRTARAESRARAHALLAEIYLRKGDEQAAMRSAMAASDLAPTQQGYVQMAARMVTVVEDPSTLAALFDRTLDTQDTAEARWAALFGKWMLAVREAAAKGEDPLGDSVNNWYDRMNVVAEGHPDTLIRRYQLLACNAERMVEMEEIRKSLAESEFGVPATPKTVREVLQLWRAEDSLRVGAPRIALHELTQLEARDTSLAGLGAMRTIALFKAREDDRCLGSIDALQQEAESPDSMLESMRWWILLRKGKGRQVLTEVEAKEEPTNATLWIEAVARFHVYRGAANDSREG